MSSHSSSYEHWPDSASLTSNPTPVEGFDTANGLRHYEYEPANDDDKEATSEPAVPAANEKKKRDDKTSKPQPQVQYVYQMPPAHAQQPMMCYPQMPYACFPQGAIPAPAYYGFPQQPQGYWCAPGFGVPPGYVCVEPPVVDEQEKLKDDEDKKKKDDGKDDKKEKKERKFKKLDATKWQGRTKVEVEEDDMIIAKKEGTYAKRKVAPIGLEADQPVWVVMGDGKVRIRTFAEAQELKGDWHEDPRFKGSLYLVCEKEEEKKDDAKNGEKEKKDDSKKGEKEKKKGGKKAKRDEGQEKGDDGESNKCSCRK